MGPLLQLEGFGIAFGQRVVLRAVDMSLPDRGCTVLLGPSGTGKSTLLRTLAGFNHANPSLQTWGSVLYRGGPAAGIAPAESSVWCLLRMSGRCTLLARASADCRVGTLKLAAQAIARDLGPALMCLTDI